MNPIQETTEDLKRIIRSQELKIAMLNEEADWLARCLNDGTVFNEPLNPKPCHQNSRYGNFASTGRIAIVAGEKLRI